MEIPTIGQKFKVSFPGKDKYTFSGVITEIDNTTVNSDREFKIQQTDRVMFDAIGNPYSHPDSIIEVEKLWFDTKETGRVIKII